MKVKISEIIMMLLLIPFIKLPDYIVGSLVNNIFDLLKVISCFVILFLSLKKKKINNITILFIVFQGLLLLSTVINTSDFERVWDQGIQFLSCVGIILYADYFLSTDYKAFYKVVSKYICFLAFLNSITMFIYYPTGMYTDIRLDSNYYFLELDNISFFTVYIGLIALIINSKIKYNKVSIPSYLFLFFQFLSYFYVDSTTAYILILLLIIFTFILDKFKVNFRINFNLCFLCVVLFMIGISVFKVQNNYASFFQSYLNKDITLTGRTRIWDRTIEYIKHKPLVGYGLESNIVMISKVGFNHIHNIFLELLYKGGIVTMLVYCTIIWIIGSQLKKLNNSNLYNMLTLFFIIFLLICQFDYYNYIYVCYFLYMILYHGYRIESKGDLNEITS